MIIFNKKILSHNKIWFSSSKSCHYIFATKSAVKSLSPVYVQWTWSEMSKVIERSVLTIFRQVFIFVEWNSFKYNFLNYRRSLVYEIQSIQEQIGNWYWRRFCVYFWCNFRWFELWQNSRQARGSSFIIGLAPWWVSHCDRIYRSANVFITIYIHIDCSEIKENDKWPFYDHFPPFFLATTYMTIFHKTEVQTVILRCLTGLNLDWFKSYDSKYKYFHFCFLVIL